MTTDDLQQQIERTRGEMADTLQAIERKLSPRQLLDQAVDTMRELVSEQSQIGSMVRDNPVPLALIGLGVGWMALSGSWRQEGQSGPSWGSRGETDYASVAETPETAGPALRQRASQMADQARESLQRAGDVTRRRMSEWSRSASEAAGDAAERSRDAYMEHPLAMGLAAMALGAAMGAILPRTMMERRMLGGSMGDMMRQARETGSEMIEKASRAAKSTFRGEPSAEQIH